MLIPSLLIVIAYKNKQLIWFYIILLLTIYLSCSGTAYLRYMYPIFLLLIILIVISCNIIKNKDIQLIFFCTLILSGTLNFLFIRSATWQQGVIDKNIIFNKEHKINYLNRVIPTQPMIEILNDLNDSSPVLFYCHPYGAKSKGKPIYFEWYNMDIEKFFRSQPNEVDLVNFLTTKKIKYILIEDDWGKKRYKIDNDKNVINIHKNSIQIKKINNLELRKIIN